MNGVPAQIILAKLALQIARMLEQSEAGESKPQSEDGAQQSGVLPEVHPRPVINMQLLAGRLNQRHQSLVSDSTLFIRYCDGELRNVAFRLDAEP